MRILPCADSGVLVELDDLRSVIGLYESLRGNLPHGVIDLVPAMRTLLLKLDPHTADISDVVRTVRDTKVKRSRSENYGLIHVPVIYDGADLGRVSELTGLTESQVVDLHLHSEWYVAFCGFSPGFAYLTGGDERLVVPRITESRTKVPAGSVGLAGSFTGIYPRKSPGGWQLIGHTDMTIWQVDHSPPTALMPGVRVKFEKA